MVIIIEKFKRILPKYAVAPLLLVIAFNYLTYNGARFLSRNSVHLCLAIPMDEKIPLIPWTVTIYLGCYVFWVTNYILGVRYNRTDAAKFVLTDLIGKLVCFLFFLFLPTTLNRPEINGSSFFDFALRLVYKTDSADNLLPSLHCFASWLCWIGIRKNSNIPKWYHIFSLVFAIAVCVSTLTVKQHVFVDTIAGIILAEGGYWISSVIVEAVKKHRTVYKSNYALNDEFLSSKER